MTGAGRPALLRAHLCTLLRFHSLSILSVPLGGATLGKVAGSEGTLTGVVAGLGCPLPLSSGRRGGPGPDQCGL